MKILFLGSSRFSLIVLKRMLENGENVVGVITQPDRPAGRGHKLSPSPVKVFALERGIKVYDFDRVKNHIDEIKKIDYELGVVASFGQILPQEFLDIHLTINVHPSLLPKYRGATPIQSAILNGDKVTGVTIMKVAKEVDSGDILLQREVALIDEYYLDLEERLALVGADMVFEGVRLIEKGSAKWTPQDHDRATLVAKFGKEDGLLDFSLSANDILNKIRALSEETGTYIFLDGIMLKIGGAEKCDVDLENGRILDDKKRFVIGCEGGGIEVLKVQAPSGKMISGRDYLNGHKDILGKKVDNA